MSKAETNVIQQNPEKHITEREAAEFLGFAMNTLAHWRMKGGGPKFIKYKSGSIRYKVSALIEFTQSEAVQADEKTG